MNYNLKNILVVDNQCDEFQSELEATFSTGGCKIMFCSTKDEAIAALESGYLFDIVILDWYLEPDNDLLSKLVLSKIKETKFLPVFIWSHHVPNFQDSFDKGEVNYPSTMINNLSKDEVNPNSIKEKLNDWLNQSISAQLSLVYRIEIKKALEEIFFDLSDIHDVELSVILRIIIGDGINIDWSNDFILNLLHRKLVREETFENQLRNMLLALPSDTISKYESKNNIVNKILYFFSKSIYPRFGDIVQCTGKSLETFFLITTPDCDLEQQKTRFLDVVELLPLGDKKLQLNTSQKVQIKEGKHPSFYLLPSILIAGSFIDFVAVFKSKNRLMVERDFKDVKYPEVAPVKISFKEKFVLDGEQIDVKMICGFSEPYKSDFLNKLTSHNTRIGTPDIKKLWAN